MMSALQFCFDLAAAAFIALSWWFLWMMLGWHEETTSALIDANQNILKLSKSVATLHSRFEEKH